MNGIFSTFRHGKFFYFLLAIILSLNSNFVLAEGDDSDLDPVAFEFKTNKKIVEIGEEFELSIIARKRTNWDSRLANSILDTDFRIKVVFPDGFEQTGGNYQDFAHAGFGNSSQVVFKIKGRYSSVPSSGKFMLLRGTKNSIDIGRYVLRAELAVDVEQNEITTQTPFAQTARSAYMTITSCSNEYEAGLGNSSENYTYTVNVQSAGSYSVKISYSRWEAMSAANGSIKINGGTSQSLSFPYTSSNASTFQDITFTATLVAGNNTFQIFGGTGGFFKTKKVCAEGGSECTTPSAPTISKTSGTTVCAQTNQNVTLTATGCSGGTINWFKDGGSTSISSLAAFTTNEAGSYTAKCTVGSCVSGSSTAIAVAQTSGCSGSGCVINKVRLQFRVPGDCCADRLVGAKIQGSNNGTTWTDLYTINVNGTFAWQEFTFSNSTAYSSVRFQASNTGWGEMTELEFYNGNTKLTGTAFGIDNYQLAFDGNTTTMWHVNAAAGTQNVAGLNLTGCGGTNPCTTPSAPTISKTSGTTVCAQTNQNVTLTATGCSAGTINWFKDGGSTSVSSSAAFTTNEAGSYTAKCTVGSCVSGSSTAIAVAQTSGCSGSGCVINKVRLQFRVPGDCCADRLVGAKIQGSNNGTTWTDLYTININGTFAWQEFTFSNTTAYSSVRFQASNTGWGEMTEFEFYNGNTKLTGTAFGIDNYQLAFDGNTTTMWHVNAAAGTQNVAGLNLTGCGGTNPCTTTSAPTISKTSGTTVCAQTNQNVTLTATGCSGGTINWFKDGGSTSVSSSAAFTTNVPGSYTAKCTVGSCVNGSSTAITVAQTSGCGATSSGCPLGAYCTTIGGREFTFNKTPEFQLQFNADGTITDVTPGLTFDGTTNKIGSNRVYYMIGYSIFKNADGSYNRLQNVYLPDGIYTVRQFICNEAAIGSLGSFENGISGWNNGVNASNSKLSEIFLSIKTSNSSPSLSITPSWLKVSRNHLYPNLGQQKNWAPYNKFLCITYQNKEVAAATYHGLGVNTDMDYGNPSSQPNTWNTPTWPTTDANMADSELNSSGRHWIERSGNSLRFVLTDQIVEKVNGANGIASRMYHFYKGAYDKLVETNPSITTKRQTGLYGTYGTDDFEALLDRTVLYLDRTTFEQSLTTHVHKRRDGSIGNFTEYDVDYYTSGQINVRNINHKNYFANNKYYLPYELIYLNERIKIGTKTYQNQDREANWIVYTSAGSESFVGLNNPIENSSSGEILTYPNGEILSKDNQLIPTSWDDFLTLGFWSSLIANGAVMWDSPGVRFGNDATKFRQRSTGQPIYWTPNGGSQASYVSSQNGAPEANDNGLAARVWACPENALFAGNEAAWNIRDRTTTLSHVSYTSSRGGLIAVAGQSGLHLNGFGQLNKSLFVIKDAVDQKKGIALVGTGSGGTVLIYYNGFLSPHEYEDNVTINGTNLGRVYGRQTIVKTL